MPKATAPRMLHACAHYGALSSPQVNATDAEGNCPAHAACMAVSLPLCEWLKAEGARFDTVDRPGA